MTVRGPAEAGLHAIRDGAEDGYPRASRGHRPNPATPSPPFHTFECGNLQTPRSDSLSQVCACVRGARTLLHRACPGPLQAPGSGCLGALCGYPSHFMCRDLVCPHCARVYAMWHNRTCPLHKPGILCVQLAARMCTLMTIVCVFFFWGGVTELNNRQMQTRGNALHSQA